MGNFDDALVSHRRALALREEAASADPNDVRAAVAVASSTDRIAKILRSKGDFPGALATLRDALARFEKLTNQPSPSWQTVRDLAETHVDIAETLVMMGDRKGTPAARRQALRTQAADEYRKARELYEGLKARGVLPKTYFNHIGELLSLEDGLKPAAR